MHFLRKKSLLESKVHFGAQNVKRCWFSTFGAQSAQKCSFTHFGTKKSKIRCRNHWFHKHLRPGGKKDPKMHFWPQKCISEPKMHFGAQKCILGSKMLPGEKGPKWHTYSCTAVVQTDVSKMWILWKLWEVFRIVRCRKSFSHIFTFLELST